MKIAIFGDPHLGYPRFEEDSYIQAERVVTDASQRADVILCLGDIFDTKIPKLESLKRAVEIFNKAAVPVYAIHGNHERRARGLTNPVQLVEAGTNMKILHGESAIFEKNGEKLQILGMGSVPEEYASTALKKIMEDFKKDDDAFRILMIHQTIRELIPAAAEEELSLEELEHLPFDLLLNGHIHEKHVKMDERFLIPGSTVITQLKKEETEPKGYFLYDTKEKKAEFIPVKTRKFFYEDLKFSDAGEMEIREAVEKKVNELRKQDQDALIAINIHGKLKEGLSLSDIKLDSYHNVYIHNKMEGQDLGSKLEKIKEIREEHLSVRDLALKELRKKTEDKVDFDSSELFERLLLGHDEALEYLEKHYKKDKQ